MLTVIKLQNLRVVADDHTDLGQSKQLVEKVKESLSHTLVSLEYRLSKKLIPNRCAVFVRINSAASLYIDVDPKRSKNPYFIRYDNKTGEVSSQMSYEEFKRLATDSGTLCYIVSRLDKIERMHMQQFGKEGTTQQIDRLIRQDSYER